MAAVSELVPALDAELSEWNQDPELLNWLANL